MTPESNDAYVEAEMKKEQMRKDALYKKRMRLIKQGLAFSFLGIAGIALIGVVIYYSMIALRNMSEATLVEKVINPRPGVECLEVITTDGVAVNCWRTEGLPPVGKKN